jgi:hypothetical protein
LANEDEQKGTDSSGDANATTGNTLEKGNSAENNDENSESKPNNQNNGNGTTDTPISARICR